MLIFSTIVSCMRQVKPYECVFGFAFPGTQTAILSIPTKCARILLEVSKIKIGWVVSRSRGNATDIWRFATMLEIPKKRNTETCASESPGKNAIDLESILKYRAYSHACRGCSMNIRDIMIGSRWWNQLNLNHCGTIWELLTKSARDLFIDVTIVNKPYYVK